jgi:heptosyltransferase I
LPTRILIVRLSALGDIVHAVPVLAAMRRHEPHAEIDWLVEASYAPILGMVDGLRRRIIVRAGATAEASGAGGGADKVFAGASGYVKAALFLRRQRYDVALDLQGLIKSAVWARLSGARRVVGFAPGHLREPQAAWLYNETVTPPEAPHIIQKNLAVAAHLGAPVAPFSLPLVPVPTASLVSAVESAAGHGRYAVLNPGAAWPNKRWPPERFGALARELRRRYGLPSFVTWGPAEHGLAENIVRASDGAAQVAPPTDINDLASLMGGAALVVSGDTGPLHIAAAMGAPIVGLFGPTRPERNGPWNPDDETISRAGQCQCHHKRQCQIGSPCIDDITLDEVVQAADRRLARERHES